MHRSRTPVVVGLAFVLGSTLAACGSTATLSAKDFRAQANQLCAAANKDTSKYGSGLTQTSSNAEVAAAVAKTVARDDKLVADIAKLKAPASMTAQVASMLSSVRAGLVDLGKISSVQDLMATDITKGPYAEADNKAKALGLNSCAQ